MGNTNVEGNYQKPDKAECCMSMILMNKYFKSEHSNNTIFAHCLSKLSQNKETLEFKKQQTTNNTEVGKRKLPLKDYSDHAAQTKIKNVNKNSSRLKSTDVKEV